MKVLIACEFSGTVRDAFTAAGHHAVSCDLLPTETPGIHYQGDVFEIINDGFDLMIAHPPCTFLTAAGVCWLHKDFSRWEKMIDGSLFFKKLMESKIKRICVENPIMHKYAKKIIGVNQTQIIQPFMFGHMEQKATCLWLKNLPNLIPTNNVKNQMDELPISQRQRLHYLPPSKDRWKIRSKTYSGIAKAMAEQWGKINDDHTSPEKPQFIGRPQIADGFIQWEHNEAAG